MGLVETSYNFYEIAIKTKNRREFIHFITNFILINRLDGLDMLWIDAKPFYYNNVNDALMKENITLFLKEFSETFKPYKLMLTSSFSLGRNNTNLYDYAILSKYLEFFQIFNARTIENLLKSGISPKKIVFGISTITGFYRSGKFNLFNIDSYKLHSRYDEICELLAKNKVVKKIYDPQSQGMIAEYVDQAGMTHSINYESTRTIANKTRFAVKQNLGGVSLLTVDMDDPYGKCAIEQDTFVDFKPNDGVTLNIPTRSNNTYPLLKTINEAILVTQDEYQQEHKKKNKITYQKERTSNAFDWSLLVNGIIDNFATG